jgi:hypothetical protein
MMCETWQQGFFQSSIDPILIPIRSIIIILHLVYVSDVHHFFPPFFAFLASACFSATMLGFFSTSSSISLNCFIISSSIPSIRSFLIYSLIFFISSISHPAIKVLIFSDRFAILMFFRTISATSAR